jgi:hypothetical protein
MPTQSQPRKEQQQENLDVVRLLELQVQIDGNQSVSKGGNPARYDIHLLHASAWLLLLPIASLSPPARRTAQHSRLHHKVVKVMPCLRKRARL